MRAPHAMLPLAVLLLLVTGCGDDLAEKEDVELQTSTLGLLTASQRKAILDAHNDARSATALGQLQGLPGATNMTALRWDSALEAVAQQYADRCIWQHNANRDAEFQASKAGASFTVPASFAVGENLYYTSASTFTDATATSVVQSWASESSQYTYNDTYQSAAGHFTQVAWAETRYVGCGVAQCSSLTGLPSGGTIVVCNYARAGNYIGQYPWTSGTACAACPGDLPYCVNGLCDGCPDPDYYATGSTTSPASCNFTPPCANDSDCDAYDVCGTDTNGAPIRIESSCVSQVCSNQELSCPNGCAAGQCLPPPDAGTEADAGVTTDAGLPMDAGTTADAGSDGGSDVTPGEPAATSGCGCASQVAHPPVLSVLLILGLFAQLQARRRNRLI